MAFDGILISTLVKELEDLLLEGRIGKVNQPEKDELIFVIRSNRKNRKLLLSSMASMPKLHLTDINKTNPITAPNFCMLLRKHLVGGVIKSISQPNFERIVEFEIENYDELGVFTTKKLIIEIMGRHSNIILTDKDGLIIDAIRRVGAQISSVREVFPNRQYVLPPAQDKVSPLSLTTVDKFTEHLKVGTTLQKSLYQSVTGLSPQIAEEMCFRASLSGSDFIESINDKRIEAIYHSFKSVMDQVLADQHSPRIYMDDEGMQKAFSPIDLKIYSQYTPKSFDSISEMVEQYYLQNSIQSRISQKSVDLRKLVNTNLERCYKKLSIQLQQIKDTEDRDKFKIRGELIHANLYQIKEGDKSIKVYNYYDDNKEINITLDPQLSPTQNAQKQYNKYNKKKRTLEALSQHIETTKNEISHLESVKYALLNALKEEDLLEIRNELMTTGYIKFRKSKTKKALAKSQPMHFVNEEGFHFYVGKNNFQNDTLSTKFANGGDWWFHAKDIAGSHVIVKSNNQELPDHTYEQAAALAAYFSKDKDSPKVSVDYTLKKNLKKPNGTPPGYVIYHTNYSMMVTPSLEGLKQLDE